jgi:hypothetical protein
MKSVTRPCRVLAIFALAGVGPTACQQAASRTATPPPAAAPASLSTPQAVLMPLNLSTDQGADIVAEANDALNRYRLSFQHWDEDRIPSQFWGPAISRLYPLKVEDRGNVVIVLREDDSVEEGLLVWTYTSSIRPTNDKNESYEPLMPGADGMLHAGSLVTALDSGAAPATGSSIFHYRRAKTDVYARGTLILTGRNLPAGRITITPTTAP